jgi:hypothetical protein
MKKYFGILVLIMSAVMFSTPMYAQANLNGTSDKVTISKSDLTPQQIAVIEAQAQMDKANAEVAQLQKKLDTYGKWVGVGGEIGNAVKEGLTAVVDVADKFGATNVGQFTMVMVAWKVVGKDVTKIIIGLLFFITYTWTLIYFFRKLTMARRVCIENPGFWKYPKKYEVVKSEFDDEGITIITIIYVIAFLIGIWVTYAVMF